MKEGTTNDTKQLDRLKAEHELLENHVMVLQTVIETHKLARFEENLGNLKNSMRKYLRLISSEFLVMEYDPVNQRQILDLIAYLELTIQELRQFTYPAKTLHG